MLDDSGGIEYYRTTGNCVCRSGDLRGGIYLILIAGRGRDACRMESGSWDRVNYQAYYRKYRPRTFDDVKGQEVIVRTLRNQVKTGRIAHAYLFCGSRGTGKTTCAKILAKAINCEHPVDGNPCTECASCRAIQAGTSMNVIEMDAASQRGIDSFRQIISEIAYPPTEGRYKVYIIDEVHMLTPEAFNAFLKTLEEPPEYAVFILATTDPQRLLPTVLSRCQRYDFRRIPTAVIEERVREVLDMEGVSAQAEAVHMIARRSEGALRDALSIADQCVSFFPGEELTYDHVLEVLGTVNTDVYRQMLSDAVHGDAASLIGRLDQLLADGRDVRQIISDLTWYLRDVLIFKASAGSGEMEDLLEEDREELLEDSDLVSEKQLMYYIEVLSDLTAQLRISSNRRVLAEIALIRLCRPQVSPGNLDALESRVSEIEKRIEEGIPAAAIPAALPGGPQAGAGPDAAGKDASGKDAEEAQKQRVKAVAPQLFQKIAAQWKQTMNSLPKEGNLQGRGQILAMLCEPHYSAEDPETLYLPLTHNWYDSLAYDQVLREQIMAALEEKYGVCPEIRFVDVSERASRGLLKVESRQEALKNSGVDFPIEIE